MALLGLDTLLLIIGILPYVRLSKFFEATHSVLRDLTLCIPVNLGLVDEALKKEANVGIVPKAGQNNKKKKKKQQAEQTKESIPETIEVNIQYRKQGVVLFKQENYSQLEQLIWSSSVAFATFYASEVFYCVFNNAIFPGRQSGTSSFLAGIAIQGILLLLNLNLQMWNRMGNQENRLSLVFGIVGFWAMIGLMGMVSDTEVFPDLDLSSVLQSSIVENGRTGMWWLATLAISLVAGIYAGIVLLPALRFARVYHESNLFGEDETTTSTKGTLAHLSFHVTFFAPLLVVLLYIEPLSGGPLVESIFHTRENWVHARSLIVIILSFIRVSLVRRVVQGYLDSSWLVVTYMVKNGKSFSLTSIKQYLDGQYWLTSYVATQYLAPAVVSLVFASIRGRFSGSGIGICGQAWNCATTMTGISRPEFREAERSPLLQLMSQVVPDAAEVKEISISGEILGPVVDIFIFWTNFIWFFATLLGVLYFRQQNTAREFAFSATKKLE